MGDAQLAVARDYQVSGRSWLRQRLSAPDTKAVLLADDAGLGKTLQALGAAQDLNAQNILVLCPAGARRVWQMEITRWFPEWSSRVFLVEPGVSLDKIKLRLSLLPVILVVGYDEMSRGDNNRLPAVLVQVWWDLLIVDEAHYLKNPSNRTIAVYGSRGNATGVQAACAKVVLLTGTPTPNHAGELYQHYRTFWSSTLLVPNRGGRPGDPSHRALTQVEFEERFTRYRDTVYGRQVVGSKNQADLRDRLRDVVLRRRKDEVLPELPPLRVADIPLAPVPDWRDRLGTNAVALAQRLDLAAMRASDDQFISALAASAITNHSGASLRRQLGELKVSPAADWITERLDSTEKILVFAWHVSVLEHLRRRLAQFDPVLVTGDTSPTGRVTAIDLFQHRRNVRVFLGQILACGTAITLTAANEVTIVEPSWVPGENVQAICRAHRLGQRDSVLASFLYLPDTLDERIMQTFRRKAVEIGELHDPKDEQHHENSSADQRHVRSGGRRRSGDDHGTHRSDVPRGGSDPGRASRQP